MDPSLFLIVRVLVTAGVGVGTATSGVGVARTAVGVGDGALVSGVAEPLQTLHAVPPEIGQQRELRISWIVTWPA